jgi:AraC family transcriptional regulator
MLSPVPGPAALTPGTHFGQVKTVRQMGSLIVAESRYQPDLETPSHWHQTASFIMVFAGSYREEFAQRQFACGPGGILYRPAGEIHRDRIGSSGAYCVMVEMPAEWMQKVAATGSVLSAPRQAPHDAGIAFRLRRELVLCDELSPFAVEALTMELACEMQRTEVKENASPRWLLQLRERIEEEFASLPPIQMLAREFGIHPGHMSRAFRRRFGCTIGEYARRRKIEYCCEHLCRDTTDLCDLAMRAGFSSQAHMTRVFKMHIAMTPGQFRRLRGQRDLRVRM